MHLEHLHLQLLSIVTEVQLKKMFQRQSNFDLGRLLEGQCVLYVANSMLVDAGLR
jgi:hypothetical protein